MMHTKTRPYFATALLPLLWMMAAVLGGCSGAKEYRYAEGAAWGTTYHITYNADKNLDDSITAEIALINQSLSPFSPGSQIARINAGEDIVVDSLLRDVFSLSQRVHRLSGGAFDPTLAPLINLWGFGYRNGDAERPTQQQIDSALTRVGIDQCAIDADGHLRRKHPETEFNFSAVAKGYGVDRIAAMLRRNGVDNYMVEVGGEIALAGNGPKGDKWRIQVDAPVDDTTGTMHQRMRVLHLTDAGIATSGNYRNYRETPQGRVAHTISPVTGYPVQSSTLSVTVIAPTCAEADALATAVMAMPLDSAKTMIKQLHGIETIIVSDDGNGGYRAETLRGKNP